EERCCEGSASHTNGRAKSSSRNVVLFIASTPRAGGGCPRYLVHPAARLIGVPGLALHRRCQPALKNREARYCEYRSQWTFPSSSPTLAIWTNSSSEHPRAHLSHCCFLPKSRAHASAPANTIWPLRAFTPALMPSVSLLLGSEDRCRQSSRCLQMFFGLLHAARAAGAVISKVASTTMPNTNGILPCVIAITMRQRVRIKVR